VPTFRPDIRDIAPYVPGRPIEDVALEYGFDPSDVIKLASNENPVPPIPSVRAAMARLIDNVHRYPDNEARLLREKLSEVLGVRYEELIIGAGSSEILRVVAMACGGPGTSAVYGWPSFAVYRLGSIMAMTERIEVPLDADRKFDLEAMLAAIRPDTTLVYLCNPNNPSGTFHPASDVEAFIDAIPERVMVLVDEAYHEFVTDPSHVTALPHAVERPNVLVARTFSKVHGLASLRVGYGISRAENIVDLRKAQAPLSVTALGQEAALVSLHHPDEISQRIADNASGREMLESGLEKLGVHHVPSQANFVYFRTDAGTDVVTAAFLRHGIILRPFADSWVRVSVGTPDENRRFLEAFEIELETLQ
jgi:histidinol-phosphate aminotransferase